MIKVFINGMGRIGRVLFRTLTEKSDVQIVGINDPYMSIDNLVYLMKYDTMYYANPLRNAGVGKSESSSGDETYLIVNSIEYPFTNWATPSDFMLHGDVNLVIDCLGDADEIRLKDYINNTGCQFSLSCSPINDENGTLITPIVHGVNHKNISKEESQVAGMASPEVQASALLIQALLEGGVPLSTAYLSIVRSYTNTQYSEDSATRTKQYQEGRAGAWNIIPSNPQAKVREFAQLFPELNAKTWGNICRVPILDGGVVSIDIDTGKDGYTSLQEEADTAIKRFSAGDDCVAYSSDILVSSDSIGQHYGVMYSSPLTRTYGDKTTHAVINGVFDNEYGFVSQIYGVIKYLDTIK